MLFVLTVFALVMRLWQLETTPPGLFYDEAFNGMNALAISQTPVWEWPIFFTGNFGREPLLLWLMGIVHALFGQSIWAIRLIPALAGALLTPSLAWLAWEVAPFLGVRHRRAFALWSGAAILALLWSQIFSRYGLRLSLFVLLQTLMWASLWRAWGEGEGKRQKAKGKIHATSDQLSVISHQSSVPSAQSPITNIQYPISNIHSPFSWLLAGIFAGLSFYTYLPARLLPLVMLPMAGIAIWQHRPQVMARGRGILLGALAALIVAAPLGIYFVQNPLSFTTRVGQVSVLGREEGGILDNVEPVVGMFAWTGDHNPRSNIPFRPALDPLLVPFFAIGLGMALWRFWRLAQIWLLAGLAIMLLPTLLSEFAPNYQRAIGALPFIVILITLGMEGAVRLGCRMFESGRPLYLALGSALILASIALTWRAYFVTWAGLPDLFPAWDVGFTRLAEQIVEEDQGVRVYVSPRGSEHPTVAYLLAQNPETPIPQGFDGRICMRVVTDAPARYYFLSNEDARSKALIDSYYPDAAARPVIWDTHGAPWAEKLDQPAGGAVTFPEMIAYPAQLSDGIDLLGYWIYPEDGPRAGERLYTRFYWRVSAPPGLDYTAFAHLIYVDENGTTTQLAGADRPPGEGSCPTSDWLPGEVVIDELQFELPTPLPDSDLFLAVGFYNPESGQRLSVPGSGEDAILIPLRRVLGIGY
jgi:4-amino-4-deoxy-L-arabinose transferase-like glycosyltransferase